VQDYLNLLWFLHGGGGPVPVVELEPRPLLSALLRLHHNVVKDNLGRGEIFLDFHIYYVFRSVSLSLSLNKYTEMMSY
jgi:hypothetical protein